MSERDRRFRLSAETPLSAEHGLSCRTTASEWSDGRRSDGGRGRSVSDSAVPTLRATPTPALDTALSPLDIALSPPLGPPLDIALLPEAHVDGAGSGEWGHSAEPTPEATSCDREGLAAGARGQDALGAAREGLGLRTRTVLIDPEGQGPGTRTRTVLIDAPGHHSAEDQGPGATDQGPGATDQGPGATGHLDSAGHGEGSKGGVGVGVGVEGIVAAESDLSSLSLHGSGPGFSGQEPGSSSLDAALPPPPPSSSFARRGSVLGDRRGAPAGRSRLSREASRGNLLRSSSTSSRHSLSRCTLACVYTCTHGVETCTHA